jgi:glutamate-ammonia-ligase adenylyltransferase
MGFADAARAERLLLTDLGITEAELRTDALVTALAAVADPDLALIGLARIFDASDHPHALRAALRSEQDFRDRLTAVLGVSAGLADHLARHPEDCQVLRGAVSRPTPVQLREEMMHAVGVPPPDRPGPDAPGGPGGPDGPGGPGGPVACGKEPTGWPRRTAVACCTWRPGT